MQSSHTWKAGTQPAPHHRAADPADVGGRFLAEQPAAYLLLGFMVLAGIVVYRAFRWFWRATR